MNQNTFVSKIYFIEYETSFLSSMEHLLWELLTVVGSEREVSEHFELSKKFEAESEAGLRLLVHRLFDFGGFQSRL